MPVRQDALLDVRGITKRFPGVVALDNVDFDLRAGEIHALLGENGAGKSTLIAVLTGALARDGGTVTLDGKAVEARTVADAQGAGLAAVYQEIDLLPNLTVGENLLLGRLPTRLGVVRRGEMMKRAGELLAEYGVDIDPRTPLGELSTARRQLVAIIRAVGLSAKVLILDEPTASLDAAETRLLFEIMRGLKSRGVGLVFVTHFLDQVYEVADRITVLRNGKRVGEANVADLPQIKLVSMMIGRELEEMDHLARNRSGAVGAPLLKARGLGRKGSVEPFDLDLAAGEVVGAAGLLGSGRTETARLLFGADRADKGSVEIDGEAVRLKGPRDAIRRGLGFTPEERKTQGIVGDLSVRDNIILALQAKIGWKKLSNRRMNEIAAEFIKSLDIRTSDADKPVRLLSGGNQQKVVLARWLATNPRLLILDEPTRGVDVGAHAELIRLIESLKEKGLSMYVVSSEVEEIAAYSDRVAVMRDRRMVRTLGGEDVTAQKIVSAIAEGGPAA
jgi:simple sugar transport system ATP-binding protein